MNLLIPLVVFLSYLFLQIRAQTTENNNESNSTDSQLPTNVTTMDIVETVTQENFNLTANTTIEANTTISTTTTTTSIPSQSSTTTNAVHSTDDPPPSLFGLPLTIALPILTCVGVPIVFLLCCGCVATIRHCKARFGPPTESGGEDEFQSVVEHNPTNELQQTQQFTNNVPVETDSGFGRRPPPVTEPPPSYERNASPSEAINENGKEHNDMPNGTKHSNNRQDSGENKKRDKNNRKNSDHFDDDGIRSSKKSPSHRRKSRPSQNGRKPTIRDDDDNDDDDDDGSLDIPDLDGSDSDENEDDSDPKNKSSNSVSHKHHRPHRRRDREGSANPHLTDGVHKSKRARIKERATIGLDLEEGEAVPTRKERKQRKKKLKTEKKEKLREELKETDNVALRDLMKSPEQAPVPANLFEVSENDEKEDEVNHKPSKAKKKKDKKKKSSKNRAQQSVDYEEEIEEDEAEC